jgi:hypothetical protein
VAKRLRLNQLVDEISLHVPDAVARKELVRQLQVNAALRRPRSIAGSTARILEHLMTGIEAHCRETASGLTDQPKIRERIDRIEGLMAKGRKMTTLLHYYAGPKAGMKRYFNFYRMIEHACHRVGIDNPGVFIQSQVPQDTLVYADRVQIEWLLETVFDEACRKGRGEGRLAITVRPVATNLTEEMEQTAATGELLEIRVSDGSDFPNRKTAARSRKSFSGRSLRDKECVMRLAAISRILKVHCGYMGERDLTADSGSVNIYLPSRKLKRAIPKNGEPTHCIAV